MEVFIEDRVRGATMTLDVETSDTVLSVKQKIDARADAPAEYIRLFYRGEEMDDERCLGEYDVEGAATIVVS